MDIKKIKKLHKIINDRFKFNELIRLKKSIIDIIQKYKLDISIENFIKISKHIQVDLLAAFIYYSFFAKIM